MANKKIIDSVKKQGQVAIKDLDEFLRFIINESDIHDLPEVVEKVFAGHPEFTHTFFHEGN